MNSPLKEILPNPFAEADDLRAENARLTREIDSYHEIVLRLYKVIDTQTLTIELLKTSRSAQ